MVVARNEVRSAQDDLIARSVLIASQIVILFIFFNVYDYTNLKKISMPKQASQALKNKDTLRGLESINEAKNQHQKIWQL